MREVHYDARDMCQHHPKLTERILAAVAGVWILKVTASVVSQYPSYFPPDFASDFLRGRETYFPGVYQWAFTTHILSGPISLILGTILVGERFRARFPSGHRRLGRLQVALVLLLVTPSGLVMARHAQAGLFAGVGLATLAVATAICASLGAWAALTRRFADHRRWMWRCYVLLCSTAVLRLMGGLATILGANAPWVDPLANWMSWLLPLAALEIREATARGSKPLRLDRLPARATPERGVPSVPCQSAPTTR